MMCAVADSNTSDENAAGRNEGGVLANLPRTRPQRSSARRAAARGATAAPARARKPARANKPARPKRATAVPADAPAAKASGPVRDSSASASAKARRAVAKPRSATAAKRKGAPRRAGARAGRPPAPEDAAPRQGFECDGETAGGSVAPPGGAELVATAAEIVGELAKAGLSTGERLFKDVLSRLPLS
jgi:hypothetical protein